MQDVVLVGSAHLLRGQGFHRDGGAIQREEFDLVGFAIAMHVHDYAHVSRFQSGSGQILRQYDGCVFLQYAGLDAGKAAVVESGRDVQQGLRIAQRNRQQGAGRA